MDKPKHRSYIHLVNEIANRTSNEEGLRRLYLDTCQFDSLDSGEIREDLFVGLDDLEELDIRTSDVDETMIAEGAFNGLGSLKMLKLTANNVAGLPEGLFRPTPALTSLRLQERSVRDFPEGLFAGLAELQRLEVQVSGARAFRPRLFAGLGKLESLEIRDMSLFGRGAIPEGVFDDLAGMRNFSLTGSGLEHAPTTLFAKGPSIKDFKKAFHIFGHPLPCHCRPIRATY